MSKPAYARNMDLLPKIGDDVEQPDPIIQSSKSSKLGTKRLAKTKGDLIKFPIVPGNRPNIYIFAFIASILFTSVAILNYPRWSDDVGPLKYGLATGITTSLIFFWGFRTAGVHINAASSISQWFLQFGSIAPGISGVSLIFVLLSSFLGTLVGGAIGFGMLGSDSCLGAPRLGHVWPHTDHAEDKAEWRAFFAHVLGSSILVFSWFCVVLRKSTANRYERKRGVYYWVPGLAQLLAVLIFFHWGGAGFNFFVALSQYIWTGFSSSCGIEHGWIPLIGDLVGGIVGSVALYIYRYFGGHVRPISINSKRSLN